MVKPIELREADFKREVESLNIHPQIKQEFFDYWSEPNKSGTKMRFELEKTWHLNRRIARWVNNGFTKIKDEPKKHMTVVKKPVTEIEKLDALLDMYGKKFESVPFEKMGEWYDYLKENKLLKTFTKEDIELIRQSYGNDNYKCRCACVQQTFDSFRNSGITFGQIMEIRQRLTA